MDSTLLTQNFGNSVRQQTWDTATERESQALNTKPTRGLTMDVSRTLFSSTKIMRHIIHSQKMIKGTQTDVRVSEMDHKSAKSTQKHTTCSAPMLPSYWLRNFWNNQVKFSSSYTVIGDEIKTHILQWNSKWNCWSVDRSWNMSAGLTRRPRKTNTKMLFLIN